MSRIKKLTHKLGQSPGGLGLQRVRAKQMHEKMKKLAKTDAAFTIKVKLPAFGQDCPQEVVAHINIRAKEGWHEKHHDAKRKCTCLMVNAFVTDANEVWARVIPVEEKFEWGAEKFRDKP